MKICIDGPKGSGKSSVSEKIAHDLNARHEYVSYKKVHNPADYVEMIRLAPTRDLVLERGPLSSWIYTFARNGVFITDEWFMPMSLYHFDVIIKEFDRFVIFYASDDSILLDRVINRRDSDGVAITEQELNELKLTNRLFRDVGKILEDYAPHGDVIQCIDICSDMYSKLDAQGVSDAILRDIDPSLFAPNNDRIWKRGL